MSARKELVIFLVVALGALGSILSFALTSHRREAQTTPGTLVRATAERGVCPTELKVRRGKDSALQVCPAQCTPLTDTPGQCECTIDRERCRIAPVGGAAAP